MIHNPVILIIVLLLIEASILCLAVHPRYKSWFNFLPSMFWIYFLPMILSTCGIIDSKSVLLGEIPKYLLPPALFLLLLNVDIKAISRLGPVALIMFFAGGFGIVLGIVISFMLFKSIIGSPFWAGFGALSASWTGGSANMIAVKEALNTPDAVFLPMVIVDTIVPYVWMGILVALVGWQVKFDQWNHSDRRILDQLSRKVDVAESKQSQKLVLHKCILMVILALALGGAAQWISRYLPVIKDMISPYAWTIVLVSITGILFSLTPISRISNTGSNKMGYFILYFVLTAIGAKASLNHIGTAGILILAGAFVIIIHAIVLLLVARWLKAPLFLVAAASQANVGGVASAPMVAEVYQPGLSSVGLLLAILGNILGTYVGILTGQLCHLLR